MTYLLAMAAFVLGVLVGALLFGRRRFNADDWRDGYLAGLQAADALARGERQPWESDFRPDLTGAEWHEAYALARGERPQSPYTPARPFDIVPAPKPALVGEVVDDDEFDAEPYYDPGDIEGWRQQLENQRRFKVVPLDVAAYDGEGNPLLPPAAPAWQCISATHGEWLDEV